MDTLVEYAGPADTGGPFARLTLNSPHNRNALSTALVAQLHQGLRDAASDPAVRLVVLAHTDGTFCAGADLREASGGDPFGMAVDRARELTALLRAIVSSPLPVIAAIDGHVRAGGFGLVGACDIAIAGPRSTFGLPSIFAIPAWCGWSFEIVTMFALVDSSGYPNPSLAYGSVSIVTSRPRKRKQA